MDMYKGDIHMSKKDPNKKGIFKEFVEFINKGNALALAIGVIIGAAFGNIVSAINTKIISPLIAVIIGDADLSNSLITVLSYQKDANGAVVLDEAGFPVIANAIYWGAFLQAVIDFLLTAIILFAIVKLVSSIAKKAKAAKEAMAKKEEEATPAEEPAPAPEPVIPEDIKLLSEIRDLLKEKEQK